MLHRKTNDLYSKQFETKDSKCSILALLVERMKHRLMIPVHLSRERYSSLCSTDMILHLDCIRLATKQNHLLISKIFNDSLMKQHAAVARILIQHLR